MIKQIGVTRSIRDSDLVRIKTGINDYFAEKFMEMTEDLDEWKQDSGTFYEWNNDEMLTQHMRAITGGSQNLTMIAHVTEHDDWDRYYNER